MLACVSSLEIAEWVAFEKEYGPIGPGYTHEALAQIHEQLQVIAELTGANFADPKQGKKNPASEMLEEAHYPRPNEYRGDDE